MFLLCYYYNGVLCSTSYGAIRNESTYIRFLFATLPSKHFIRLSLNPEAFASGFEESLRKSVLFPTIASSACHIDIVALRACRMFMLRIKIDHQLQDNE